MKILLTLAIPALLIGCVGLVPHVPNWRLVGERNGEMRYVDTNSIRADSTDIAYLIKIESSQFGTMRSFERTVVADCRSKQRFEVTSSKDWTERPFKSVYANTSIGQEVDFSCGAFVTKNDNRISPQPESRQPAQTNEMSALVERCKAYGYPVGTTPMADCVRTEAQIQQVNAARKSQVLQCKAAMMGRPTGFGSMAETLANVNQCDTNPNAHLADQPGVQTYQFPDAPAPRRQVYCYTTGGHTTCREQ